MKKWIVGGLKAILQVGGNPLLRAVVTAMPGGAIIDRVITAATAIEEAGAALKGPDKENAAMKVWTAIEVSVGNDVADDEKVREAVRRSMQAYVAVKNAEVAFAECAEAVQAAVADARSRRAGK